MMSHITSMNAGMKDLLNVADKMIAMGQTVPQVVEEMTSALAHEIRHDELGNLSVGSPADLAAFSVEHGAFGFVDMNNQRKEGSTKLVCQLTIRAGKVVYDLNGVSSNVWNKPPTSDYKLARHWITMTTRDESKKVNPTAAH